MFDAEGIDCVEELPHRLYVSGERRTLVQCYYQTIDWSSPRDVRKVLRVFEQVLDEIDPESDDWTARTHKKLVNLLRRDKIVYEDGGLTMSGTVDLEAVEDASMLIDPTVLREHITRIQESVESDPAQALGSAKELIETAAKLVLDHCDENPEQYKSVQQLAKAATKCLGLDADSIDQALRGAKSMKRVLAGLAQIVSGMAELRNLYGTGHGRHRPTAIQSRHGQLGVNAAAAWVVFVLATLDERKRD